MRAIYVGHLTEQEQEVVEKGLQSKSAFTVRRSQIILKSAKWQSASQIAKELHCTSQTVRNAIRAYHQEGVDCLEEKSHARHDQQAYINEAGGKRLKEIIRLSPRTFGYETSLWSRELLAQQLHQEGHSRQQVCPSTITETLQRVGISWRRAKKWIRSPDPAYQRRKKDEIG
jgi:transposase